MQLQTRKTKSKLIRMILPGVPLLAAAIVSITAQAQKTPVPTPAEAYQHAISNPEFTRSARKGEAFCWHARGAIDDFITGWVATQDTAWLDAGFQYCDFLVEHLDSSPDGYKGWIGPFLYDNSVWQDVLVGDALLFGGMLDYCMLVKGDKRLQERYAEKTTAYIDLAKKNFYEKYDERGTWKQDGPYGGYVNASRLLHEGNLQKWVELPQLPEVGVSHPFNKQMDAGLVFVKLYELTGEKKYRDRAESIFFTAKSHFQYFDDHYCWNYYEPLYPGDVDLKKKDTRHGIWVHPWRSGYQASEVEKIVEAYHYGIVFDETDIRRIIHTNLDVMWNKDRQHPRFINSNGLGADGDTSGIAEFQRVYGHSNVVKNGGELWTGLLDFDQTIRDLYELRFRGDTSSPEYIRYRKTVLANPPGFKRKYVEGPVTIPVVKFTECKDLSCAVVLPHQVPLGGKSIILCKSWKGGALLIDLYAEKGNKVGNLYAGRIGDGLFMIQWDGKTAGKKAVPKGNYKIRWTINGGYREFPVVVDN